MESNIKKELVLCDNRIRDFEEKSLISLGYSVIKIPTSKCVYKEISSHVDIFASKIKNTLVLEPSVYDKLHDIVEKNTNILVLKGRKTLKSKYPFDILYNVCITKSFAIANFNYIDDVLLEVIEKNSLKKIHIKQGYSKCSIAVLGEDTVALSDKKVANILEKNGLSVILLDNNLDIHLIDENCNYSNMNGFVGGAISRIDDILFVTGDISSIDKSGSIRKYANDNNLKIIDFYLKDIIDYGGILKI